MLDNKKEIRSLLLTLIFIFVALSPLAVAVDPYKPYLHNPIIPDNPGLNIKGEFETNNWLGSATYEYPLEVPTGTNKLAPIVTLNYNHHNTLQRPGKIGAGWELNENYIWRDVFYSYSNTSDDLFKLVLNGQQYNLIYNSSDTRYHTEIESNLYIKNFSGGNNTKGEYWVVINKNGDVYRFGYNNDSELISNLHNYTVRWSIDKITDTSENNIYYLYNENPSLNDTGAVYPFKIEYNNDRQRVIEFKLENYDRPDKWLAYEQGNKIMESRRISEIQIKSNDSLVRKYVLNYTLIDGDSKSFLSSISLIGSDNVTSSPPVKFEYYNITKGWLEEPKFRLPSTQLIFDSAGSDYGIRIADLNRDGLIDIIKADGLNPNQNQSWINNGTGWVRNDSWKVLESFVDSFAQRDKGVRIADVNGDGFSDILLADGSSRKAWLNSMNGWLSDNSTWYLPTNAEFINSGSSIYERGTTFIDFNGDGLEDIISATDDWNYAWINTGKGWTLNNAWRIPTSARFIIYPVGTDEGVRIADVNGDRLPDLIKGKATNKTAWINNGTGWVENSNFSLPAAITIVNSSGDEQGVRIADVNGDGLDDLLQANAGNETTWINTGKGWTLNNAWNVPERASFVSMYGSNEGVRIADVNGDGLVDLMNGGDSYITYINKARKPYLLKKVINDIGGSSNINYIESTKINNKGSDSISDLGFALWIVDTITETNNLSNSSLATNNINYQYEGGLYDYSKKEFRGFNHVDEITENISVTKHYFNQSDSLKGVEYRNEIYDKYLKPFKKIDNIWRDRSQGYFVIELTQTIESLYDSSYDSPKINIVNYTYDSYGNVLNISYSGDNATLGDEKFEYLEYVYNLTNWVMKVKRHAIYDSNNTKIREIFFRYDNLSYNATPLKGMMSWEETWLNGSSNPIKRYEYNNYGNLIKEFDPKNNTISYIYGIRDTTYTFPDRIINAKNHTFNYWYDLGTSKLVAESDGNSYMTNYTYDVLGRLKKGIKPYDNSSSPTTEYTYYFDGLAPESIKVSQKNDPVSSYFDTFYFYDGMGNLIQLKSEGLNGTSTTDYYYDGKNRLIKKSNPYFSADNIENYTSPYQNVSFFVYTYDPLDRLITSTNTDSSYLNITYQKDKITEYDERGNKTIYTLDGYGRIIQITNFDRNNYFKTYYNYDVIGNLLQVTDDLGKNISTYNYDTLGRKTKEYNLDSGTWQYNYDLASNLINQTDNRGVITYLTYDELNRVKIRNTTQSNFIYSYDLVNGTLSSISSNSMTYNYSYDQRLRNIKEIKIISGRSYTKEYNYSSADDITLEKNPDGWVTKYAYSGATRIKTAISRINPSGSTETFVTSSNISYNAAYLPTNIPLEGAASPDISYEYDQNSLRVINLSLGSWKILQYSYDSSGNVIQINDSRNNMSDNIAYDYLNRLASIRRNKNNTLNSSFDYTYSFYGEILKIASQSVNSYYYYGLNHAPSRITKKIQPDIFVKFVYPTPANSSTENGDDIFINVSSTSKGDHYVVTDFDNSLVGWWRLEKGNGTLFVDETRKNNATCSGSACPTYSLGYWNGSYDFDGSSDQMSAQNSNNLNITGSHTISLWVYMKSLPTSSRYPSLIGKHTDYTGYGIYYDGDLGGIYGLLGGGGFWYKTPGYAIPVNSWHNVVVVYDDQLNYYSMYVDGSSIGATTSVPSPLSNSAQLVFGKHYSNPAVYGYLNATMDEITLFNRALTSIEVKSLYNATANQYYNNFVSLNLGNHTVISYGINKNGTKNSTDFRTIKLNSSLSNVTSNISFCQTISLPGIYELTQNITTADNCFVISANGVTIDGKGYTINGSFSDNGIWGVYSSGFNKLTVRNLSLKDIGPYASVDSGAIKVYNGANITLSNIKSYNSYKSIVVELIQNVNLSNIIVDGSRNLGVSIYDVTNGKFTNINATNSFGTAISAGGDYNSFANISINNHSGEYAFYSEGLSSTNFTSIKSFNGNSSKGIYLYASSFLRFNDTTVNNTNYALWFDEIDSVTFTNTLLGNNNNGIHSASTDTAIVLVDTNIVNSSNLDIEYNNGQPLLLVNATYNKSKESITFGDVIRQWYVDVQVTNRTGSPLQDANVSARNNMGTLQFSKLTASNGYIQRQNLTEYINSAGSRTYYSNYTINATKSAYSPNSTSLNITSNINLQLRLS